MEAQGSARFVDCVFDGCKVEGVFNMGAIPKMLEALRYIVDHPQLVADAAVVERCRDALARAVVDCA